MQDPIYVAFATQKGGAGKSTLTTLVASYLHYVLGKRVLALDCDPRQHSMVEYREKDKLLIRENPVVKRRFARFTSVGMPMRLSNALPPLLSTMRRKLFRKGNRLNMYSSTSPVRSTTANW